MKTNIKRDPIHTAGGAEAQHINPELMLRRIVLACMLFEDNFYEDGQSVAERIKALIPQVEAIIVSKLAVEAREKMKLRHAPLLIAREMARHPIHKRYLGRLLPRIIQRPDEITEFLALYWKDGKCPLANKVKMGLAFAFQKFDEYQFAKYDREAIIKLRDALFLCHSKPKDLDKDAPRWTRIERKQSAIIDQTTQTGKVNPTEGEVLYKKIVDRTLVTPDTWEVSLSGGADKKETFERLMAQKKLGGLAFIRNMRNMKEADVSMNVVADYAASVNLKRVLPFRFIAAARACPQWEPIIESMMNRSISMQPKLPGKTILILDTSGSMAGAKLSSKSDLTRLDVAGSLAMIIREIAEEPAIYCTAGDDHARTHATSIIPPRRGFALASLITNMEMTSKIGQGGIFLAQCMDYVKSQEKNADRIIVITDEQDCDNKCNPSTADAFGKENYLINISSEKNGIGYGKWTHIDGFSEAIIDWIMENEKSN